VSQLELLLERIPDVARDLKVGLGSVLESEALTGPQRWGVALSAAHTAGSAALAAAFEEAARAQGVGDGALEDARAAAALMAMTTVYYRFRHQVGKPVYAEKPARLRMQRLAKPATTKADLELMSLAAATLRGCEACVRAHEEAVLRAGLTEDQVHDAVRIAATVNGVATALSLTGGSP
jgi:lipoyl-dependent peroxiredoxin subunit D